MSIQNRLTNKIAKNTSNSNNWMVKMVSSYSLFLLAILVLFFFLYQSESKSVYQLYNMQSNSSVINSVKLFEKNLDIIDVYCRQLAQDDNFRKFAAKRSTNESFVSLEKSIQKQLNSDSYISSLLPIENIYCYFPNTKYVLTSSSLSSRLDFTINEPNSTYSMNEILEALTIPENCNQFLSLDAYTSGLSKHYYIYIVDVNNYYYLNVNAFACFVFADDQILNHFEGIFKGNAIKMISISDSTGTTNLCFNEENELDYDFTSSSYTSNQTNFTYTYVYPRFDSSSNIRSNKTTYLVLVLFAFLIGGILIFIFSKRNLAPIIELGQELSVAVEAQNNLQMVVDNQKPIIRNSYVRRLLAGAVTEDEISFIKDFLELNEEKLYFNGLYVCVYNNSKETAEVENFDRIVEEAISTFLRFNKPIYSFNPTDRAYAIFLTCDENDEKEFILTVSDAVVKLHNYLLDNFGIWLFAGMGKSTNNLMSVWESYQQAVEAVSYTSKNYIFFPYEFIKKDSNIFYYPPEISTKLIHFITTGNKPQVMELFSMIHQENIEERALPINLVKFLLSDIRNTLLKARFALPSSTPDDVTKSLDDRFNEHASFKLCEDIALNLCDLFSVKSDDSDLITAIEKYIDENFADPSMGLNKISDEFEISESYFSHMFKDKTGVNFSTYLENKRMEEATRLIKETDVGLNELYISVGYNNANSFRRAFKKIYGITPSEMRNNK